MDEYVDIKEAARILHLCEDTVSEYLRKGILKGEKRPLWGGRSFLAVKWFTPKSELEKYISPHVFSRHIPNLKPEVRLAVAWAIAAEGTITINPSHSRTPKGHLLASSHITISNTKENFVREFFKLVGEVGSINVFRERTSAGNDEWRWQLRSIEGCLRLLEQIYEYLPIKKEQAEIVMKFCKLRLKSYTKPYGPEEIELIKRIRILQYRGKRPFDPSLYNKINGRRSVGHG